VLQLVDVEEGQIGRGLISHPGVDRLILTGGFETAQLFRSWRADLPLLAETSGKNALIVTPSADFDLAVADIVKSAFGHAGQKCSAASLVILVGSVAKSERFRRQLMDAVTTLRVGYPDDPESVMGPVIERPGSKLNSGLTELGPGESWLLTPQLLDDQGRLWSPGVREGVKPGSTFHQTEYFGPILGIMSAKTLDEALSFQNGVDYGLTAGIHSLDPDEVSFWLDRVEAGNCYVNRGITGAIVQRQPFGGWKKSSVGPGTKAGGPNYLLGLGSWRTAKSSADADRARADAFIQGLLPHVVGDSAEKEGFFLRSLVNDERAWSEVFGISTDETGLTVERNVFRYRPTPVTVRAAGFVPLGDILRVILAGARVGARVSVSLTDPLPDAVLKLLRQGSYNFAGLGDYVVETEREFVSRVSGNAPGRIRLLGSRSDALSVAFDGAPEVAIYGHEVTESGRVEMLPFVVEQAVSLTAHRFGALDPRFRDLAI
jgi:RHH-type proline utilization regulon transcriptional repressor/proline dehydrogenase/delta 1-pyrroline-5-carboxylate dehydrogenase